MEIFGINATLHVLSRKNAELRPKNSVLTVKHGGGTIILWGCFPVKGERMTDLDEGRDE